MNLCPNADGRQELNTKTLQCFCFQFFFTSPPLIISQMEIVLHLRDVGKALNISDKMNDFVPTLILW